MLLLCSDAIWEFITPQQCVVFVKPYTPDKAVNAADQLAREVWIRWLKEKEGSVVDDIIVVVIFLKNS